MKPMLSRRFVSLIALCAAPIGCAVDASMPEGDSDSGPAIEAASGPDARDPEATMDMIERVREAKRRMADDPVAEPALDRLMGRRGELGFNADHTFKVKRVTKDSIGGKHARLDHYYKGARVINSTAIVHFSGDVATEDDTHALKHIAPLSTDPRVTQEEALKVVAARPEHVSEYSAPPTVELCVRPVIERFVRGTDRRVTGEEQDLNALDVEPRVVDQELVYQIDTIEPSEPEPFVSYRYLIDARSGRVVESSSLAKHGTGNTFNNPGPVTISTSSHLSGSTLIFDPKSVSRNFGVYDHDACEFFGTIFQNCSNDANLDSNNTWGDGMKFQGDGFASDANRQTAIADGLFALQSTWDMFSNVWNRDGYNDDFFEGNAYVHSNTEWDDAMYNSINGQIFAGDGPSDDFSRRYTLDTFAHEYGHGIEDFTADMGNGGETGGISEASADIIGEIAEAYTKGDGPDDNLTTIPASPGPNWKNEGSGRNFKTANGRPYWSSSLKDLSDEHERALPMIHAFYFLSQGASSNPVSSEFSVYTPWGTQGIGIDSAARIWIMALTAAMSGDTSYADARASSLYVTQLLFLPGSNQYKQVMNSFGAINVGSVAGDYPADPPYLTESEPNDSVVSADSVSPANVPSGAPLKGTLSKRSVMVGSVTSANKDDWFVVSVASGKTLRVTIRPTNDDDIYLYDAFDMEIDHSANGSDKPDQVSVEAPSDGMSHPYYFKVRHYGDLPNVLPMYQAFVDIL